MGSTEFPSSVTTEAPRNEKHAARKCQRFCRHTPNFRPMYLGTYRLRQRGFHLAFIGGNFLRIYWQLPDANSHSTLHSWGCPGSHGRRGEGKEIKDPKSGKLLTVVSTTAGCLPEWLLGRYGESQGGRGEGGGAGKESTDHRNRSISSHSLN